MQAEEAALLAVDMAAAERRIHSALDAHISELRQQTESEKRAELSEQIELQVRHLCTRFAVTSHLFSCIAYAAAAYLCS